MTSTFPYPKLGHRLPKRTIPICRVARPVCSRAVTDLEQVLNDPLKALDAPEPEVRRLAIAMLSGAVEHLERIVPYLEDPAARVRAETAESLGTMGQTALIDLLARTSVEEEEVAIEALASALGEIGDSTAIPWLMEIATNGNESLTRETAVASLGAIGDKQALPLLLELVVRAPPQVRRRAVVALSVFDGDEVEAAVNAALEDRNPMVREAALMVAGRQTQN